MQTSAQNTGRVQRLALKRGTVHRSAQNTGNSTQISTEYWEQYKNQQRIPGTVCRSAHKIPGTVRRSAHKIPGTVHRITGTVRRSAQNIGDRIIGGSTC